MSIITHPHDAGESLFELTYRDGLGLWTSIPRDALGNFKFVGYARVSSGKQLQSPYISEQFDEMDFYANILKGPLLAKFIGKSSSRQVTREPLHDALKCCTEHGAHLMIAYQSRLARHARMLGYYSQLFNMLGVRAFALYADRERMRRSLHHRRQKNLSLGNLPIGMKKSSDGHLVRDASDHELYRMICDLKQGKSYDDVAAWLNQHGIKTKKGGMWTRRSVAHFYDALS